jgi:hypothetical protein
MGSGDLAVEAMSIGCLSVERCVDRFFSYLAILRLLLKDCHYKTKGFNPQNVKSILK